MPILDTWNRKLWSKIKKNTDSWLPLVPEASLLWAQFIGFSVWPEGYWMHHKFTNYLDVQRIDKGNLIVIFAKEKFLIPEKTTVLIPPGEYRLAVGPAGYCEKRHLGLSGTILNHHIDKLGLGKLTMFEDSNETEFNRIFDELFRITREKAPCNVLEYAALSYKLLLFLANQIEQLPFPKELILAKSFIDWNFSEPLALDKICHRAGCGKTTLQEQFRKYLKTSPVQYLISKRMQYAKLILKDLSLPVKTVSDMCGFENQLYFSNTFKQHFSCSPRDYRKSFFSSES